MIQTLYRATLEIFVDDDIEHPTTISEIRDIIQSRVEGSFEGVEVSNVMLVESEPIPFKQVKYGQMVKFFRNTFVSGTIYTRVPANDIVNVDGTPRTLIWESETGPRDAYCSPSSDMPVVVVGMDTDYKERYEVTAGGNE